MIIKLKGLSLIEVLVASTLLAITVTAVMSIFIIDQRLVTSNYRSMLAEEVVRYEFERLNKLEDPDAIFAEYGYIITQYSGTHHSASGNPTTFTRDGVDYSLEFHISEIQITGSYISQPVTPVILQVEAVITWDGGSFTMRTAV